MYESGGGGLPLSTGRTWVGGGEGENGGGGGES